ncbi:hypothetical protein, partial [Pseudomonas viridiflava]|uniref:hypothetical protein n=1 Tax=Pseudomonas viridiflava TaxID=33069 RepID=UPI0019D31B67
YQQRADQEQAVDGYCIQGRYSIENESKTLRAKTDHAVRVPRDSNLLKWLTVKVLRINTPRTDVRAATGASALFMS